MGNVLSLMDQPDDESYAPRYHYNPQKYHPSYATEYSPYYNSNLTSTEEENTRQSYEQSRYERSKREKIKRKELERFELEQEEYARNLREHEALERFKLQDERDKRKAHGINNNISYQIEQNMGFKNNPDIRQNVEYEKIYSYNNKQMRYS